MDIPKCFAYNREGLRCMQAAGHEGVHAHAIEWTDDETWDPSMALVPPTVVHIGKDEITEHLVAVPEPSGKCVICGHRMHERTCTDMDGEFNCDCATGVEE